MSQAEDVHTEPRRRRYLDELPKLLVIGEGSSSEAAKRERRPETKTPRRGVAEGNLLIQRLCMRQQDPDEDYICNLDADKMFVCWSAPLDGCNYNAPIILPWNFFRDVVPPVRATVRRSIFL